jgi:WD40 repeat protein
MLRVFDQRARRIEALPGHRGPIRAVSFSRSGALAATGGADHLVRVWDAVEWRQLAILQKHTDWVRAVCFLDDDALASASDDGSVLIWDLTKQVFEALPRDEKDFVHCLAVDPGNAQTLVCGSQDGHIEFWDVPSLTKLKSWRISESVRAIALSNEQDRMMAAGFGGEIHVWNLRTGEEISRYTEHDGWVRGLVFTDASGSIAASCGADGCARLWEVEPALTRRVLRPKRPYEGMIITQATGLDTGTVEKLYALGAKVNG